MSNEQNKQNEDMEFEQMMEQRLHDNFRSSTQTMSKSPTNALRR